LGQIRYNIITLDTTGTGRRVKPVKKSTFSEDIAELFSFIGETCQVLAVFSLVSAFIIAVTPLYLIRFCFSQIKRSYYWSCSYFQSPPKQ